MQTQNTNVNDARGAITTQFTTQEQAMVDSIYENTGAETIKGIPFSGLEVGLIDMCYFNLGTEQFETAYSALVKINPMAQVIFAK